METELDLRGGTKGKGKSRSDGDQWRVEKRIGMSGQRSGQEEESVLLCYSLRPVCVSAFHVTRRVCVYMN